MDKMKLIYLFKRRKGKGNKTKFSYNLNLITHAWAKQNSSICSGGEKQK